MLCWYLTILCCLHVWVVMRICVFVLPLLLALQSTLPGRRSSQLLHSDVPQFHRPHSLPALWMNPLLRYTYPVDQRKRKTLEDDGGMKLNEASFQSSLELFLDLSVSYLDQDILAEAREGVFEAIKTDVMPLPHRAAHTIAHFLCATPLPVLAHTVNDRAC